MTARYRPREIASVLKEALREMPVVALTGLRQTGKSFLLQHDPAFADRTYISLDDFAVLQAAREAPGALLQSADRLTIDEVQRCPELFVAIKQAVDQDRRPGRFLLSGSANFALLRGISESLAGRAVYFVLHPFTRRELQGELASEPFVMRLFHAQRIPQHRSTRPISQQDILIGGMPPVCLAEVRDRSLWFRGYEQTYLERDVRDLSRVADLVAFRHLLRLAALRTAQVLKQSELARDAKLNSVTAGRYLALMEASFVLWRLPPFLRSRSARLIKSPKLHFGDVGLVCHLAGIDSLDPSSDEPMRGPLFETYVALNLAATLGARWPNAKLQFWHVQGRHEVDLVIEVGRDCIAIEVKASERWNARDLACLRAFLDDTPRCRAAVLAYNGTEAVSLGDRLWAIPAALLVC